MAHTQSPMDPALTRQTIGELIDSWTAQVVDSVEHIKQCETAGIVSVNLYSGVNMAGEAMGQQGTKLLLLKYSVGGVVAVVASRWRAPALPSTGCSQVSS